MRYKFCNTCYKLCNTCYKLCNKKYQADSEKFQAEKKILLCHGKRYLTAECNAFMVILKRN